MKPNIRNVAIIAHVDHGKTTLVDALLRQSDSFRIKEEDSHLIMDSNELERERGITIFSKNAAVTYKGCKINIIDTPGHADFGGEVERIMTMANGALLLVDAKDGPMPQTKFVLKKALEKGHKVIVVINKIDVPEARVQWVLDQTFGLFVDLGATDEQADFPVLYASAIQGKAGTDPDLAAMKDITSVFDAIVEYIPAPKVEQGPTQMLIVNVSYDSYKGQIAVGPLVAGTLKMGQQVKRIEADGKMTAGKVTAIMTFDGLARVEVAEVAAGDIVAISGVEPIKIGETIADFDDPKQLPVIKIDEPTVKMSFAVNTSPLAGTEGEYSTSRHLKTRLMRETLSDVALRVEAQGSSDSAFTVFGRGELHLAILVEKMLREGYEFQVGKPQVIFKEEDGKKTEPFEDVYIECPEEFSGTVIERMGKRKGEMKDMKVDKAVAHMHFLVSTRGLIGYRSEFLTDTRGEGIISTLFHGYLPYAGGIETQAHGSLVAHEAGVSRHYGLVAAQGRGVLFIKPGIKVYEGMIVGQNSRAEDIDVNVCKEKKLSNMRAVGDGAAEGLHAHKDLSLEEAIEYLGDDELLEVTPKNLRLRKMFLSKHDRKRAKSAS
ncbi:MAG: translational GTPase TypA [Candidatus Andersenbacteria bacterium]|nr:translational GTPase TypA [Candidatus Andersenbacteria bacterium]MBI3250907.1 translational GTPase TypA [Candidatus Andersenbacteria bacterium]